MLTDVSEFRTASIIRALIALMMEAVRNSETSVNLNALMMEAVRTSETSVNLNALMMKAVSTSETSGNLNVTTRRYIPEDSKLLISTC
jgi:hypothetical protein